MKKCAKCNEEYPLDNFPKDKTNKSCGHRSYCFPCNRKIINEVTLKRKDKRKQENVKNRKQISEYNKLYRSKNKKFINSLYKNKLDSDPSFKIAHNTRVRINKALKNNVKHSSTIDLLGCNIEFYKQYLEQQFKPDMTWENYGVLWEIDHIKGCCTFDLTKLENQQKCFHYSNTQPLYKIDNQRKNKY
jgi:hypothetical protein